VAAVSAPAAGRLDGAIGAAVVGGIAPGGPTGADHAPGGITGAGGAPSGTNVGATPGRIVAGAGLVTISDGATLAGTLTGRENAMLSAKRA
jgi:hypothetical protein